MIKASIRLNLRTRVRFIDEATGRGHLSHVAFAADAEAVAALVPTSQVPKRSRSTLLARRPQQESRQEDIARALGGSGTGSIHVVLWCSSESERERAP